MNAIFRSFAEAAAQVAGSPYAFLIAAAVVVLWMASGPAFGWSDTWQLMINTGTTIVTFLMVFLIQTTQNRDARALHLKLDEIIRSIDTARNQLIDAEHESDEQLDELATELREIKDAHPEAVGAAGLHRPDGNAGPDEERSK